MNADLPVGEPRNAARAVRVQVVFHVASDQQAEVATAKMIDRAHEIANLPECECDVDIGIDRPRLEGVAGTNGSGDAPARGQTTKL